MDFWKWYLRLIKTAIFHLPKSIVSPIIEYLGGGIIITFLSLILSMYSPYWLLLTIPIGVTLAAHGWWRVNEQIKMEH